MNTTYFVKGMTCQHCIDALTEELSAVEAVQSVDVALSPGGVSMVHVDSSAELDDAAVSDAVEDAGYEVVDN